MKRGDKVRIVSVQGTTGEPMLFGAMYEPDGYVLAETVEAGTVGTYHGPHSLPDWYLVRVEQGEMTLYVPLHESQIEVA